MDIAPFFKSKVVAGAAFGKDLPNDMEQFPNINNDTLLLIEFDPFGE